MTRASQGLPVHHLAMKTCPSVFTAHIPRAFSLLLLVASLNAQNESWDSPLCNEGTLSVPRGSRAVMTCNISNAFTDVTVWLKDRVIFYEVSQGNFNFSGWELQVQGGQARLMIENTQEVHTGLYFWQLHGRQRHFSNFTLNVSAEPSNQEPTDVPPSGAVKHFQKEARPDTLVGVVVTVVLVLGLTGIGALICYRHHHSSMSQWISVSMPVLRRF
ncbi:secreted and transmembrane protein 1A isoform X1 [Phodopus roborovskii]|uniref:secreted and transmembrane protein 1A isoform X1 n=1 Tax=Phodopus roborovskii TaxID=109678 RepID=UPI0021E4AACD|nr:secreted and transmembrane protein 1A isoform X1 [Phodopus roborovskii]